MANSNPSTCCDPSPTFECCDGVSYPNQLTVTLTKIRGNLNIGGTLTATYDSNLNRYGGVKNINGCRVEVAIVCWTDIPDPHFRIGLAIGDPATNFGIDQGLAYVCDPLYLKSAFVDDCHAAYQCCSPTGVECEIHVEVTV